MLPLELERVHPEAVVPRRMTAEAAGHDLFVCLGAGESVRLRPGERALLPTGWKIAIPMGFEGQVRPRSGLAARHGVTVLNAPGTIDADYRGELRVLLVNHGAEAFAVAHGERVAQLVIAPVVAPDLEVVDRLPPAPSRGEGGFGSTGA